MSDPIPTGVLLTPIEQQQYAFRLAAYAAADAGITYDVANAELLYAYQQMHKQHRGQK